MSVHGLTKGWVLVDIPGLGIEAQTCWRIRCLGRIDPDGHARSPALEKLREWQKEKPKDYEKLLRAMRYGGANRVHMNPDLIRKDHSGRNVYEFKNTACKCRLMFFKHQQEIICTNAYWKGKGNHAKDQDAAFGQCHRIRQKLLEGKII